MTGWFLDSVEIEGFRGINNEGDPLVLTFGQDAVNSVSAPNGVGKSSIFDALTFALRKRIAKLDARDGQEDQGRDHEEQARDAHGGPRRMRELIDEVGDGH